MDMGPTLTFDNGLRESNFSNGDIFGELGISRTMAYRQIGWEEEGTHNEENTPGIHGKLHC